MRLLSNIIKRFFTVVRRMSVMIVPIAMIASHDPAAAHGAIQAVAPDDAAHSKPYTETLLHKFTPGGDGQTPYAGLVGDAAGDLYGVTYKGGTLGYGTVFKLTRSGASYTETVLYSFAGGTDGTYPYGPLIIDGAGNLYGTTVSGGSALCFGGNGCGTVFELTPSGPNYTETVLYRFSGGDGAYPGSALLFDASGSLYGTTSEGGNTSCKYGCGTVFKLAFNNPGYTESVLYAFQNGSDGGYPGTNASLIADAAGALYGTASQGGIGGNGVVFKLTPTQTGYTESVLYAFAGGSDGQVPEAGLLANKSGALFGTTAWGGNTGCTGGIGCGTIFELTPSGSSYSKRTLHIFTDGKDGSYPNATLIANSLGELYGTTVDGGSSARGSGGTVYRLKRAGSSYAESVVFTFANYLTQGSHPEGGVILDKSGDLYGTTLTGGIADPGCGDTTCGTVFRLKP